LVELLGIIKQKIMKNHPSKEKHRKYEKLSNTGYQVWKPRK